MPPLYKQKSRKSSEPLTQCKDCGSDNTKRVHRTFFEKFLSGLTAGKYAYQKFYCKACKTATYKSISEAEKGKYVLINEGEG
jgi:ribosomal protein L44E